MSFAESQMAKFGWKQGEGLGKNRDGIKKSISVVKKNDTKGLGGKLDKWDFAWWDHVYNKSASNIQVNKDESGSVKVEKQGPSDIQVSRMGIISTSRPAGPSLSTPVADSPTSSTASSMVARDDYAEESETEKKPVSAKSGPSWLFGFVKASASSTATEEEKKTDKDFTTSAASFAARPKSDYESRKEAEGNAYKDYSIKVSDKELFEACEGRTARKGARGEQPGKLGRVMQELLLDDGSVKVKRPTSGTGLKDSKDKKKPKLDKKDKKSKKEPKEKKAKKEPKEKKEKREPQEKKEKKEPKEKKEKKEPKDKKEKKERKAKEPKVAKEKKEMKAPKEKKERKEPKEKKEKKDKESKKRKVDDDEPRSAKKSKKSKSE